jgi:S1-C subfamily serine protease
MFKISNIRKAVLIIIVLVGVALGGALVDRRDDFKFLDRFIARDGVVGLNQRIVNEENSVIDVSDKVSPSVVTVSAQVPQRRVLQFDPFGGGFSSTTQGGEPQDIGSGFIVSSDGVVVTNKHVVSSIDGATYKVITSDDKEYEVKEISRDPANDLAILKIEASGLKPVELGDSSNLKVGQFVVAIGTALGEFRHTVTTGVISGLGRGITAGSAFEGYVERLDDVIQTDAAINPGNSGGPLLNSVGQVIGINVAVAQGAQNIGFAIPINVIKDSLNEYSKNGGFAQRPFLGIRYQMIDQRTAVLNNVPQGAYVLEVIAGSAAGNAGIQVDDIITEFGGKKVSDDENGLTGVLGNFKGGDKVKVTFWRGGDTKEVELEIGFCQDCLQ